LAVILRSRVARLEAGWYKEEMDTLQPGISFWLMPDGEVGAELQAWIDRLAVRFGTARFPAHVTLVGEAAGTDEQAALEAARRAAEATATFTVRLDGIDGRDEHYRCLFAVAETSKPLLTAHEALSRALGREPDPAFLPHLSLVYGTLPEDQKLALRHEAGVDVSLRFDARRLHAWRTGGPVADWREIAAFDLAGR
jgi:2'-5' RNA ligase